MKEYKEELKYLDQYFKESGKQTINKDKCIKELKKGKPIQYIIGNVNFYGNIINVNNSVLIPRFETELLVDKTINKIKKYFKEKKIDILDLGTGSGCIAITLKKETNSYVDAVDISKRAIKIAKKNALENKVDINFIKDNMVNYRKKRYDVIISNPPYLNKKEDVMQIVKKNEPRKALYAKKEGLYFYYKIIKNIPCITKNNYLVCFEIGENQADSIVKIIKEELTNVKVSVEKDYHQKNRFIFITNFSEKIN